MARAIIFVLGFIAIFSAIHAKHYKPSEDCLNGIEPASKCCAQAPDHSKAYFKHPTDCNLYYKCDDQELEIKKCNNGKHWSVEKQNCKKPKDAKCTTISTTTEKPSRLPDGCYDGSISAKKCCSLQTREFEYLADHKNCHKFFKCVLGKDKPVHMKCPGHTQWSVEDTKCIYSSDSHCPSKHKTTTTTEATTVSTTTTAKPSKLPEGCYDGSISAKKCCSSTSSKFEYLADPKNCHKYYKCVSGHAVNIKCPHFYQWSIGQRKCIYSHDFHCPSKPKPTTTTEATTVSTTTTVKPSKLPEGCYDGSISAKKCCSLTSSKFENLADPKNCHMYYKCVSGHAVHIKCPHFYQWSIEQRKCIYSHHFHCPDKPTTSTTTAKTTEITAAPTTKTTTEAKPEPTTVGTTKSTVTTSQVTTPTIPKSTTEIVIETTSEPTTTKITPKPITTTEATIETTPEPTTPEPTTPEPTTPEPTTPEPTTPEPTTPEPTTPEPTTPEPTTAEPTSAEPTALPGGNCGSASHKCRHGLTSAEECCKGVPYWEDVLLQNNDNCGSYFQCVHEKPEVRICPAGLYWNADVCRCEWKNISTCNF